MSKELDREAKLLVAKSKSADVGAKAKNAVRGAGSAVKHGFKLVGAVASGFVTGFRK